MGGSVFNPIDVIKAPFKAVGNALNPDFPKPEEPPPPPPTFEDRAVEEAGTAARKDALKRRGRAASIMTGATGVTAPLGSVNRPEATRAAALLGQVG